jgi:hypothetical protein
VFNKYTPYPPCSCGASVGTMAGVGTGNNGEDIGDRPCTNGTTTAAETIESSTGFRQDHGHVICQPSWVRPDCSLLHDTLVVVIIDATSVDLVHVTYEGSSMATGILVDCGPNISVVNEDSTTSNSQLGRAKTFIGFTRCPSMPRPCANYCAIICTVIHVVIRVGHRVCIRVCMYRLRVCMYRLRVCMYRLRVCMY